MAEDRSVPYVLAAREIPAGQPPDAMEVHPARCIFCARVLRHFNDGGDGMIVNAVIDGVARQYLYCNEGPCSETSAPWIWRCGCAAHYIENVGDYCGACRRPRRWARPYQRVECPFCECRSSVDDRGGLGRNDACPDCAESDYRPVPYDVPPFSGDTSPWGLCEAMLVAAAEDVMEAEGLEVAWRDVEELFLTPEQVAQFWKDERVENLLKNCLSYESIAEAVYGPFDEGETDEE